MNGENGLMQRTMMQKQHQQKRGRGKPRRRCYMGIKLLRFNKEMEAWR